MPPHPARRTTPPMRANTHPAHAAAGGPPPTVDAQVLLPSLQEGTEKSLRSIGFTVGKNASTLDQKWAHSLA